MSSKKLNYDLNMAAANILKDLWYGHIPALYSFKTDTVGATPANWTVSAGAIVVAASVGGHANVIESDGVDDYRQTFVAGAQTSGTIEFWIRQAQTNQLNQIYIQDAADNGIIIQFNAAGNIIASESHGDTVVQAYLANTWYHFRIIFDCATDTYDLYINGTLMATYDFKVAVDNVTYIKFLLAGGTQYIDAVDYSWATGYFTNRSYPVFLAWILASL